jgi:IclR family acetate operon transcriptional repressor
VAARGKPKTSSTTKSGSGSQVQSLVRGLRILEVLADSTAGLALTDLSDALELAPSTAHRLLSSLEQQGFVSQDQERGRWFIGVKAFAVGNGFLKTRDVVSCARPFMRELVAASGETSNLAILDHGDPVFIAQVECEEMMRMVANLGGRAPVHASGVGKAMLSSLSQGEVNRILRQRQLTRFNDNTLTTKAEFIDELRRIREQGYSFDNEEQSIGLRCIAANIYNEHAEAVAAVSISGPRSRITDERVPDLGQLLIQTANQITEAMGGIRPRTH